MDTRRNDYRPPLFGETDSEHGDGTPIPKARHTDPDSSKIAGKEAERFGSRHAALILAELRKAAPATLTGSEISARIPELDRNQISRRLPELERFGLVQRGLIRASAVTGRAEVQWLASGLHTLIDEEA